MKRVIVFDFDGVIVPSSEKIKSNAWHVLYSDSDARALFNEAEEKYGCGRGGDRYDIIRYVLTGLDVVGTELEQRTALDAAHFDDIVQERICAAGVSHEIRKALAACKAAMPTYVNTATPLDAIERTLCALEIRDYFTDILGRPQTKVENFAHVAQREQVTPGEITFLGDSLSDFRAATSFGCVFVGLGNDENGWNSTPESFPVVVSVAEFVARELHST